MQNNLEAMAQVHPKGAQYLANLPNREGWARYVWNERGYKTMGYSTSSRAECWNGAFTGRDCDLLMAMQRATEQVSSWQTRERMEAFKMANPEHMHSDGRVSPPPPKP